MDEEHCQLYSRAEDEMDDLTGLSPPVPALEISLEVRGIGDLSISDDSTPLDEEGWIHLDIVGLREAHRSLILAFESERNVRLQMEEMLVAVGKTLRVVRQEKFEAVRRAEKAELFITSSITSKWRR